MCWPKWMLMTWHLKYMYYEGFLYVSFWSDLMHYAVLSKWSTSFDLLSKRIQFTHRWRDIVANRNKREQLGNSFQKTLLLEVLDSTLFCCCCCCCCCFWHTLSHGNLRFHRETEGIKVPLICWRIWLPDFLWISLV